MVPDVSGYYEYVSTGTSSYWRRKLGGYYLWSVVTGTRTVKEYAAGGFYRWVTVTDWASFISPGVGNYGGPIWQYNGYVGNPTYLSAGSGVFNPRAGCSGSFSLISKYNTLA